MQQLNMHRKTAHGAGLLAALPLGRFGRGAWQSWVVQQHGSSPTAPLPRPPTPAMLAVALLSQFCQLHRSFCVGTVGSKRVVPVDHQPLKLLRFAAGRGEGKGLAGCPGCCRTHPTAPTEFWIQCISSPAVLPAAAHLRRDFVCLLWPPPPPPLPPRFLAAMTTARRWRPTGARHVLVSDCKCCGAAQVGGKRLLRGAWLRPGATAARRNAAMLDIVCTLSEDVK